MQPESRAYSSASSDEPSRLERATPLLDREVLYQLTQQLLTAQDDERRRIARELHDGTAATMVALSLELTRLVESLPPGEKRELAEGCASLCEQSLRELRSAAFVLHPPSLEREGLGTALRWLTDGFSKRSGIQVTFEEGLPDGQRFPPHVELALYRVAQEALTNVLRHSGSRTATVAIATGDVETRLTIRDAGKGRKDGSQPAEGMGISSMRERVRALGGRLRLTFRSTGTVLTAAVPRT